MSEFRRGSRTLDVCGIIIRETDKAVFFDSGTAKAWLPKSQIKDMIDTVDGAVELSFPEWLVDEKELI